MSDDRQLHLCRRHRLRRRQTAEHDKTVMAVELSTGMMVDDVKLALNGSVPVEFYGRAGGNVPSVEEIAGQVTSHMATLV